MTSKFIDCHTHAHFAAFKDDYREVIERALKSGVSVVNVGTQKDTSAKAVEVAHGFDELTTSEFSPKVWAVVGLHPIHTEKSFHDEQELGVSPSTSSGFTSRGEDFDYEYYKNLALDPKTVAIGECGLDYYHVSQNMEHVAEIQGKQKETFIKQIELAYEVKKPLMIHCRDAFADLIEILNSKSSILNPVPGVVHFFTGTMEDAKRLLDLGFYFTFGGVITFARSYDEVIKMIPMNRLLSETDAPYVTPEPYRGKRNEPAYVVYVVRKLAEIKGVTEEEMAGQIWENAKTVFRL
ncbi:MAG: TatD family hydrolase [bacterium]|nr:TatD family hydrolase [bacterium]